MIDEIAFLRAVEACTFPPERFGHREHVRLAWLYLREDPLLRALARVCSALRRFATAAGRPDRYHETITWAYVFLINERMERTGRDAGWAEFALRNQDLLAQAGPFGALGAYYREETLRSELARRVYLLPDRNQDPPCYPVSSPCATTSSPS